MKIVIAILILVCANSMFAQKEGMEFVDSLKSELNHSKDDTSKVRLLGNLSFHTFKYDTDLGIQYATDGLQLAEKLKWGLGIAFCYNYLATNYAVKGNYPKALEYFTKSFTKYTEINDRQGIAFLSNNLCNLYRILNQYPKALDFGKKAVQLNIELNNKKEIIKSCNNLGFVYSAMNDYSNSNYYYFKALEIVKELNNQELKAQILINIAENKMELRDYCGALELGLQAITICEEIQINYDLAVYNSMVGEIYLKLANDNSGKLSKCNYYSLDKKQNLISAKKYFQTTMNLLEKIQDLSLISETSLSLSHIYDLLGDSKNALIYYKRYSELKDSIFSKDNSLNIANIEKKQEIALRDKQIIIKNLEIDKKDSQLVMQIALFVSILLLLFILIYFYNRKQKKLIAEQKEIERNKAELALKESEEKYRSLFENAQEGIFQTNVDGKYLSANPALAKMLHFDTTQELIDSRSDISYETYLIKSDREKFLKIMNEFGYIKGYEYQVKTKDGEIIWLYEDAKAIKNEAGEVECFEGFVVDITERKKYESEILIALDKAKESDSLKTAFLQNLSHEVRTPLNGIIGFSNMLQEEDISIEEIANFAEIIKTSGIRLLDTINSLLDISKLEIGQLELNRKVFQLDTLCSDLLEKFSKRHNSDKVRLNLQLPENHQQCIINADEIRVNQIVSNLINNAIKFTKEGQIDFGFEFDKNQATLFVKDSGIGISEADYEKIFDRFIQLDDSFTRGFEGAGLGLTISKGLAELHGGKIWVESNVGIGSTFYFRINLS